MSTRSGAADFLRRWSQRKLGHPDVAGAADTATPRVETRGGAGSETKSLAIDSDRADDLHRAAFRRLWAEEPALFEPDELDDYLEDFSESARAVAPDLLVTAYAIGRGFWPGPPAAEEPSDPASSSEPRPSSDPEREQVRRPDADQSDRA
jgi:hypothetical protein